MRVCAYMRVCVYVGREGGGRERDKVKERMIVLVLPSKSNSNRAILPGYYNISQHMILYFVLYF